jgi:hypothetical protein
MARQDHSDITPEQIDEFLDGLAQGKSVAEAAGGDAFRRRLYRLRAQDTPDAREFAQRWKDAYDEGTDVLEKEAQRRAVEGVDEPRMLGSGDNAELVQVRKYSDTLMIFLLKARRPEKYRDNAKVESQAQKAARSRSSTGG